MADGILRYKQLGQSLLCPNMKSCFICFAERPIMSSVLKQEYLVITMVAVNSLPLINRHSHWDVFDANSTLFRG